jgi:hypothetical protein
MVIGLADFILPRTNFFTGCVSPTIAHHVYPAIGSRFVGVSRLARVGVMRCMVCGGKMILAEVKPDDAGMVAGFKHETLQCSVCGDIERRFVFGPGSSEKPGLPPVPACPHQPAVYSSPDEAIFACPSRSSSSPQSISSSPPRSSSPPEAFASASTWVRAVEKLRCRQADICVRAHGEEKVAMRDFNQAWEKLGGLRKQPTASDAAPRGAQHLARKSARALREELRGSFSTGYHTKQSTIERPAEEIQRFNRFWDNLLLTRHRSDLPTEAPTILAEPLPRSLSLVRVENLDGVSVAARAILLLRGGEALVDDRVVRSVLFG